MDGTGIYGIGSGAPFAIGALESGATVEKALEVAEKRSPYTAGPFQIIKQSKSKPKQA